MQESLQNYIKLCKDTGNQPDSMEFMAWVMFGLEPEWYEELKVNSVRAPKQGTRPKFFRKKVTWT